MLQPVGDLVAYNLLKLNTHVPYDLLVSLPGIYLVQKLHLDKCSLKVETSQNSIRGGLDTGTYNEILKQQ